MGAGDVSEVLRPLRKWNRFSAGDCSRCDLPPSAHMRANVCATRRGGGGDGQEGDPQTGLHHSQVTNHKSEIGSPPQRPFNDSMNQ
jgi:hypothetical protein